MSFCDAVTKLKVYVEVRKTEVTGFGCITKQYEISTNPEGLKKMNVTIPEIVTAFEQNKLSIFCKKRIKRYWNFYAVGLYFYLSLFYRFQKT